ncbi:protein of unknown function [Streptomyces sp. KY75]|nr:protein of unknown function [Streptomyces sp. KY70]CAD5988442.1 protein of unknown function [Streptomyces sp. KY75]
MIDYGNMAPHPCATHLRRARHQGNEHKRLVSSATSESLQKLHRHTPPDLRKCESRRGVTESLGLFGDFEPGATASVHRALHVMRSSKRRRGERASRSRWSGQSFPIGT